MKKLLLILMLIPNLVMADVCVTSMFITNTPSDGKDIDKVYEEITKSCKKNQILKF